MALEIDSAIPWTGPSNDPLAGLHASATTPDEGITAELTGLDQVVVRLRPGVFETWPRAEFEEKLGRLALRLWANRTRAFRELRESGGGGGHASDLGGTTQQADAFRDGMAALVAIGCSPDDRVTVTLTGEHQFVVRLAPDALTAVDQATFTSNLSLAATALIRDLVDQVRRLKFDVFG